MKLKVGFLVLLTISVLGGPIDTGHDLYIDLQRMY